MIEKVSRVKNIAEDIINAEKLVVYGAKRRGRDAIAICETLAGREKISVVVSSRKDGQEMYVDGYKINEICEVLIDRDTIVLVAMNERYFEIIDDMVELKSAKEIIYLETSLVRELKSYAADFGLKKLGIDLRLFNGLYKNDILVCSDPFERANSITEKAWEIATLESAQYVNKHMRRSKVFLTRNEYHSWLKNIIKDNQTKDGINLEFGVASGYSLWQFASDGINKFYGFDSFEGLPEDWMTEYNKGTFGEMEKRLPEVPNNVELIEGWFDSSLKEFIIRDDIHDKKADFIHVDCDLYASTKTVFEYIGNFIRVGTIIAFDEYFNYPGWQFDEFKAFKEYVADKQLKYEYLAYVDRNAQVCVRITEI